MAERVCDVKARGVFVGVYATQPNDEVVGLKSLCGIQRSWPESKDVVEEMNKKVKFWLIEPLCRP